jgi:hypothetical protein
MTGELETTAFQDTIENLILLKYRVNDVGTGFLSK